MDVCGELHVPAALPSTKEPPVPINMRLLGFQNKSRKFGEEEDILPLPGIETNVMQLCIF
jgi:hypothetical protein